jgi:SPP1 family predicted phage head-tail adaptor
MSACSKYSARMMRHRVTFERQVRTSDGAGGYTDTWQSIGGAPRWAMMQPVKSREVHDHARQEARPRNLCVTRYNDSLTEADRVIFRSKAYNVRDIRNVEFRDLWLEIDLDGGVAT